MQNVSNREHLITEHQQRFMLLNEQEDEQVLENQRVNWGEGIRILRYSKGTFVDIDDFRGEHISDEEEEQGQEINLGESSLQDDLEEHERGNGRERMTV